MATLAVTNDFSAGAAIVASEMNTNFTDIETFINSTPGVLQLTGGTVTGAVTLSNTLTVGVDDTGYDVKLFGATAGSYTLWDESEDELRLIDSLLVVGNTTDAVDMGLVGGVATIRGINVGASAYNDLSIRSASGTQLYLDTAGLVGIGRTPTDSMKLDIETTNAATYARLRITDTYSSYSPAAWYIEGGSNTFAGVFMGDSGDVDIGSMLYYNTDNSLRFTVNASERMTIDSSGTVDVVGTFTAGTKTFDIAHPTKGGDWRLRHASVEGPRNDLIYRGTATLSGGTATVDLDADSDMTDGTWEALCTNPWAMVASSGNAVEWSLFGKTLTITSDTADAVCSWMVIAERHDAHVMADDCAITDNGHLIVEYEREASPPPAPPEETE